MVNWCPNRTCVNPGRGAYSVGAISGLVGASTQLLRGRNAKIYNLRLFHLAALLASFRMFTGIKLQLRQMNNQLHFFKQNNCETR